MNFSQDFKQAYVDELLHQVHHRAGNEWPWLEEDEMVGSVYFVEDKEIVYCTPAVRQYLGGEEVPPNDNCPIQFCRIREESDSHEMTEVDYFLTYNMPYDLARYQALVGAYKQGALV
jgi:hypothetical protein